MSDLSAAEMKDLLIEVVTVQLRTARADLDMDPNDQGNPETGRMSSADSVRLGARLLREMEAVPADDPRIVRLTELVPSVDLPRSPLMPRSRLMMVPTPSLTRS